MRNLLSRVEFNCYGDFICRQFIVWCFRIIDQVGTGAALYCALGLKLPWFLCLIAAILAGAALGAISGLLKAYCNVNEVISCIMLNWISLYAVNMLLTLVKEETSPYTFTLSSTNEGAILPSLGLGALFSKNQYVGLAIPLAILTAVLVWVLLDRKSVV